MSDFVSALQLVVQAFKDNFIFTLKIIAVLWGVHILNWLTRYHLNALGVYPRHRAGLLGIVVSPLLHGNFSHLIFNSIPLFILINLILIQGKLTLLYVTVIIVLLSGSLLWLFGRKAIHIGASGVVMGYWGYLLVNAIKERTALTIILAILCLYYFAGLVVNLFPTEEKHSWEGHVFGFLAGIVASYLIPIWIHVA